MNDEVLDDEIRRQIQHVILDMLAAVDVDGGTRLPDDWLKGLTADLQNLGAVSAWRDDEEVPPALHVDITPLTSAVMLLLEVLVQDLVTRAEQDRLVVINAVRVAIDDMDLND